MNFLKVYCDEQSSIYKFLHVDSHNALKHTYAPLLVTIITHCAAFHDPECAVLMCICTDLVYLIFNTVLIHFYLNVSVSHLSFSLPHLSFTRGTGHQCLNQSLLLFYKC